MSYEILDRATIDGIEWVLATTGTTKHFKNGKPNLHVEVSYSVELANPPISDEDDAMSQGVESKQRFWMKSKAEATKYFKELTSKAVVVERSGAHALKRLFG